MNLIAIDPGASGGIAWLTEKNAQCCNMPETRGDCIALIKRIVGAFPENWTAYHEKIAGFIPDGGASMMFEFGRNVERMGCILETVGVRVMEVPPKAWQKALALGIVGRQRATPGMSPDERKTIKQANARAKTEWKNKLKAEAQRRFPGLSVTLKTADALLILDFARRVEPNEFRLSEEA